MLLGDIGVGKTSLARRLVTGRFDHDYKATIGVDIYSHEISLDAGSGMGAIEIKLLIWDIDGDFGDSIFKQIYIKGATSALVIGDCSRRSTIASTSTLARAFAENFPGRPLSLIINKTDLIDADGLAVLTASFADLQVPVVATSAKGGSNVGLAFQSIARAAYERGF